MAAASNMPAPEFAPHGLGGPHPLVGFQPAAESVMYGPRVPQWAPVEGGTSSASAPLFPNLASNGNQHQFGLLQTAQLMNNKIFKPLGKGAEAKNDFFDWVDRTVELMQQLNLTATLSDSQVVQALVRLVKVHYKISVDMMLAEHGGEAAYCRAATVNQFVVDLAPYLGLNMQQFGVEYATIQQRVGEGVTDFTARYDKLLKRVKKSWSEPDVVGHYLHALQQPFKVGLAMLPDNTTFTEVYKHVLRLEKHGVSSATVNTPSRTVGATLATTQPAQQRHVSFAKPPQQAWAPRSATQPRQPHQVAQQSQVDQLARQMEQMQLAVQGRHPNPLPEAAHHAHDHNSYVAHSVAATEHADSYYQGMSPEQLAYAVELQCEYGVPLYDACVAARGGEDRTHSRQPRSAVPVRPDLTKVPRTPALGAYQPPTAVPRPPPTPITRPYPTPVFPAPPMVDLNMRAKAPANPVPVVPVFAPPPVVANPGPSRMEVDKDKAEPRKAPQSSEFRTLYDMAVKIAAGLLSVAGVPTASHPSALNPVLRELIAAQFSMQKTQLTNLAGELHRGLRKAQTDTAQHTVSSVSAGHGTTPRSQPKVKAVVAGEHPVYALIDSGSSLSMIPDTQVNSMGQQHAIDRTCVMQYTCADGNRATTLGVLRTTVRVGSYTSHITLHVNRGATYALLLGMDFLKPAQAELRLSNDTLELATGPDSKSVVALFHGPDNKLPALLGVAYSGIDSGANTEAHSCVVIEDVSAEPSNPASSDLEGSVTEEYNDSSWEEWGSQDEGGDLEMQLALCEAVASISVPIPEPISHTITITGPDGPTTVVRPDMLGEFETQEQLDGADPGAAANTDIEAEQARKAWQPLIDPGLSEQDQHRLREVLEHVSYGVAFSKKQLGSCRVDCHVITTEGTPFKAPAYRTSPAEREAIAAEIEELLSAELIRPSKSPWGAPVLAVPKKDGTIRVVVDYRQLNKKTKRDAYTLPLMDSIFDGLHGAQLFTTLDAASGFWQVAMHPDSVEKTAFTSAVGHFEWLVMPMGLTNSPATFQRVMDIVLADIIGKFVYVYLDDVVVFSSDFDSHLEHIVAVVDRMREAGIRLSPKKCRFAFKEVALLGFRVSNEGITMDPAKVEAITQWPPPQDVVAVRRFLATAGWPRRLLARFSEIAQPLQKLLRAGAEFVWGPAQQQAFENLKTLISSDPVVRPYNPDPAAPVTLHTDWQPYCIAAMLTQRAAAKEPEHVVAYASKALVGAESRLSAYDGECLAVLWAVEKFRCYLASRRFVVYTDHQALRHMFTSVNVSSKITRWAIRLSAYDFDVVYRTAAQHRHVDGLTRALPSTAARAESFPFAVANATAQQPSWPLEEERITPTPCTLTPTTSVRAELDGEIHCPTNAELAGQSEVVETATQTLLLDRLADIKAMVDVMLRRGQSIHIALEGNIGAGKTSLLYQLQALLDIPCHAEPVETWTPFLEAYYAVVQGCGSEPSPTAADVAAHVFTLQTRTLLSYVLMPKAQACLTERSAWASQCVFAAMAMSDLPSPYTTLLSELFASVRVAEAYPNTIIYVDTSPDLCMHRVTTRGRECERDMTIEYLTKVDSAYHQALAALPASINLRVLDGSALPDDLLANAVHAIHHTLAAKLYDDPSPHDFLSVCMVHGVESGEVCSDEGYNNEDEVPLIELLQRMKQRKAPQPDRVRQPRQPVPVVTPPHAVAAPATSPAPALPEPQHTAAVVAAAGAGPQQIDLTVGEGGEETEEESDPVDDIACEVCGSKQPEFNMLLCDCCNKGYHTTCLTPPLSRIPQGDWMCVVCADDGDHTDIMKDTRVMDFLFHSKMAPVPLENRAEGQREQRRVLRRAEGYVVDKGELYKLPYGRYRVSRKVPRIEDRAQIIQQAHDELGHFGANKIIQLLTSRFTWSSLSRDVRDHIRTCDGCQRRKIRLIQGPPMRPIKPRHVMYRSAIDSVGPFPVSGQGHKYMLVWVEYFTKWVEAEAVPSLHSKVTADFFLRNVVYRHGCPEKVVTDNGSEYQGEFKALLLSLNIKQRLSQPYMPRQNGLVERTNRTLLDALKRTIHSNPDTWESALPKCLHGYRITRHSSTGYSPYRLMYGREPTIPAQLPEVGLELQADSDLEEAGQVVSPVVGAAGPSPKPTAPQVPRLTSTPVAAPAAAATTRPAARGPFPSVRVEDLAQTSMDAYLQTSAAQHLHTQQSALGNIARAQAKQVAHFAAKRKHAGNPVLPAVGSLVMVKKAATGKLAIQLNGPFTVVGHQDVGTIILEEGKGRRWPVSVDRVQVYHPRSDMVIDSADPHKEASGSENDE